MRAYELKKAVDFLNNLNAPAPDPATLQRLLQAAKVAAAAGRDVESDEILARAARIAPAHPAVLNELGLRMMQRAEPASARELFQRATAADPNHPALWSNLASSLHALQLEQEEQAAINRALALEPRHVPALLQQANIFEARGEVRRAARIYRDALALVPPDVTPPPALAAALERARAAVRQDDAALAGAIEARLAPIRAALGGGAHRRVDWCIDLLTAQRSRYESQPTFLHFPGLPTFEFYDNAAFPWLAALEAATDDIRGELNAVLASDQVGLEPYVTHPAGAPLDRWRELNHSRRWSAYFLWNQGRPQPEHLARCPRTAATVQGTPQCEVDDHGPNVFFSILDARTRIPPHTGVTNARLTVHLPLVIPPGCGFRVGSDTRAWIPGQVWVFDDTVEHEAWNDSDTPRAVLIFEIWNPYLSHAERTLVRSAIEAIGAYYGGAHNFA